MASEGGGKIRPKKSQASNKPYERKTSLFGKLKSSVKDLLIPSWLSSSSTTESDVVKGPTSSRSQDTDVIASCPSQNISPDRSGWAGQGFQHERPLQQPGSVPNSYMDMIPGFVLAAPNGGVYQRLSTNATVVSPNITVGTPMAMRHSFPKGDWKSDSSFTKLPDMPAHITTNVEKGNYRGQRLSDSLGGNGHKEPHPVMVSTGGARQSQSSLSDGKKQTLWSPASLRQGRPLIPPARGKPVFNSLLFGTPSKLEQSSLHDSFGESMFYAGKTQYGGASSVKKRSLNASLPYQSSLPLRKQVRATRLNTSLNATTSATAQRILDTLDRMSGPLADGKNTTHEDIGNDSVLSFTPSSYRRNVFETLTRPSTRQLQLPNRDRGPPASQLLSTSQANLAYNRNIPVARSTEEDSCLTLTQEHISVPEENQRRERTMAFPDKNMPSGNTGKMKAKKFSQHISSGRDERIIESPALRTDFKLPVSNLNPISLTTSNPVAFSSTAVSKSTDRSPLRFTFSTPKLIENRFHPTSGPLRSSTDKDFTFSTPLQASKVKTCAAGAEEGSKFSLEPAIGASSGVAPGTSPSFAATSAKMWEPSIAPKPKAISPDIAGTSSSFKSYTKWSGSPKNGSLASNNSPGFGAPLVASSLKEGSVMDILGGGKRNADADNGSAFVPLSALFKKAPGAWDCQACLVQNTAEALRCVACETAKSPKSSTHSDQAQIDKGSKSGNIPLSSLFKKPAGSWDCDTCLIRNTLDVMKCVACETPRPGSKPAPAVAGITATGQTKSQDGISNSWGNMFKKPEGTWTCDTCLVSNPPALDKCPACETPKPGAKTSDNGTSAKVSNSWGNMFKKPEGTWTCDACLVSNPPALDKCPACETPKPGAKKSDNAPLKKSDNSLSSMFKKPKDSWDCDTCLVVNISTALRCIACDSPKSGLQSAGVESPVPTEKSAIKIQPGGGFAVNFPLTTATSTGPGGFKFGNFGASTTSTSATSSISEQSTTSKGSGSSKIDGGFKFGNITSNDFPTTFGFGDSKSKTVTETSNSGFGFGSQSKPVNTCEKAAEGPTIVSPLKKNPGISTGVVQPLSNFTDSNKSDTLSNPGGFKLGSTSLSTTSSISSNALGSISAQSFSFGATSTNKLVKSSNSPFSQEATPKPTSLFTFGASSPSQNPGVPLGMGGSSSSLAPMVNGGFGSAFDKHNEQKSKSAIGFGAGFPSQSNAMTFGIGATPSSVPTEINQSIKRSGETAEIGAPKAKIAFTNMEPATNGGFSFNASASGFGAKAPVPSSGFNFNATPGAATPTSGFQFSGMRMTGQPTSQTSTHTGFSFTGSEKITNPPPNNNNNGGMKFNSAQSFNFSSGSDSAANAVFQFGTSPAPAATTPSVYQFGSNASLPAPAQPSAPVFGGNSQPFSIGSGNTNTSQRKVKRAVRRIPRK